MVSLIKMRPWYMPMMTPFGDEETTNATMSGLNIYEKEGRVHIEAPIPGIPSDKVDITYTDGKLHISATDTTVEQDKEKKKVIYRMERNTTFEYVADMPANIDPKTIEAESKDGVLYITASIAESAKPRKIAVKTK